MEQHKEELPGGPGAPRRGRRVVDEVVGRDVDDRTLYELKVLVSELVTNAVRHGPAGVEETIVLTLGLTRARVRVEVCDPGPGFDPPKSPRARVEGGGGNGLVLLDRIASSWGVASNRRRNCVWFEMEIV